MQISLENVWEEQGDALYASCAQAVMAYLKKADAVPDAPRTRELFTAVGAALMDVDGGEEPEDIEIALDAPALEPVLSELICELARVTDFGVHQIGMLLREISTDRSLDLRDEAALADKIKNLDLRHFDGSDSA